jgi:hypothetical protein
MDSHIFSDPEPVDSSTNNSTDNKSTLLAWYVHVYRQGGTQVGTLLVDDTTLPPRKRKGKIVWKLPDDGSIPKFGTIEKERLWELFKQQKKERRKKLKDQSGDRETDQQQSDCKDVSEENKTNGGNDGVQSTEKNKCNESFALSSVKITVSSQQTATLEATNSVSTATLDDARQGMLQTKEAALSAPIQCSVSSYSPPPPPPPPPGFAMSNRVLHDNTAPPGLAPLNVDATIPAATQFMQPSVPSYPLDLQYFSLEALSQLPLLFTQCISTGRAVEWLRFYAPTAQSSLVLASAQVTFPTLTDRIKQWESLQQGPWDCQGWTRQPIHNHNSNNNNHSHSSESAGILVVMSGRTRQQNELLAFCLSLVLERQQSHHGYQIVNDILSLTPVTSVV